MEQGEHMFSVASYSNAIQGKTIHFASLPSGKIKCSECGREFIRGDSLWHKPCFKNSLIPRFEEV